MRSIGARVRRGSNSCHVLYVTAAILGFLVIAVSGCGGGSSDSTPPPAPPTTPPPAPPPPPPPPEPEFDTTGMLTNFSDNIIARNYDDLLTEITAFVATDGSLASLCSVIGEESEESARSTARERWRQVIGRVQATEMHVIGPALANGEALRHRLMSYSAGQISTCGIDQSAALVAAEDPDFNIETRSSNQRGFGALEYLLFNENLNHTCASQVTATMGWNELGEPDRRLARCELALEIAGDAATAAELLDARWATFRDEFIAEGNTGTTLQLVTDAIFAIDTLVKDDKLGIPMGIHDDCSAQACPDSIESKYARNSLANIRANVVSFLDIFTGIEGLGFDDLIVDEGYEEVSERFVTNLNAVTAAIDAAQNDLYDEAIGIDSDAAVTSCTNAFAQPDGGDAGDGVHGCRITGLLKRVTDDLKIDFVTIVDVSIPGSAQTDND